MRRIAPVALLLVAVLVAVWLRRARSGRAAGVARDGDGPSWPPLDPLPGPAWSAAATGEALPIPDPPVPPAPGSESAGVPASAWVTPEAGGTCPASHPVKAKNDSRIFHVPGGRFYERTRPDRCYVDAATARADGYRASKA